MNYSCIIQYRNPKRGKIKSQRKMKFELVNEDKKLVCKNGLASKFIRKTH